MHSVAGGVADATPAHVSADSGPAAPPEPPGNQPAGEPGEADDGGAGKALGGTDEPQGHHLPDVHHPGRARRQSGKHANDDDDDSGTLMQHPPYGPWLFTA